MTNNNYPSWWFFTGTPDKITHDVSAKLDNVIPPWRNFIRQDGRDTYRGSSFVFDHENEDDIKTLDLINAALYLHRPMLVKGNTGVGKSSLAYAIAHEFGIGNILYWPITSHTSIKDGLYRYDIIRHLQTLDTTPKDTGTSPMGADDERNNVGRHFSLKQLGSALASPERRVLLIDELDKADMDLPNDLLHVLEEGRFQIDELVYQSHDTGKSLPEVFMDNGGTISVEKGGWVYCKSFPIIVITSNLEREFPPAFLRRCITIELKKPSENKLQRILIRHFKDMNFDEKIINLVKKFDKAINTEGEHLATDRLLSAVHIYLKTKSASEDSSLLELIEDILLDTESKRR